MDSNEARRQQQKQRERQHKFQHSVLDMIYIHTWNDGILCGRKFFWLFFLFVNAKGCVLNLWKLLIVYRF